MSKKYDNSEKIIIADYHMTDNSYIVGIGKTRYYKVHNAIDGEEFIVGFTGSAYHYRNKLIKIRGYINLYGKTKTHLFLGELKGKEREEYINEHPEYFI